MPTNYTPTGWTPENKKKKPKKNDTKTKQLPKGSSQSQSNDGMAQLSRRVRDLPPGVLDPSLSHSLLTSRLEPAADVFPALKKIQI